jgi:hypothetical protein
MRKIKQRLAGLERAAAMDHRLTMFERARQELGLPLPTESDHDEGLKLLQDCLSRCKDATPDAQMEIMGEFKNWVAAEHERFGNGRK